MLRLSAIIPRFTAKSLFRIWAQRGQFNAQVIVVPVDQFQAFQPVLFVNAWLGFLV